MVLRWPNVQPRDLLLPVLVCASIPACGDSGGGTSSSSSPPSESGAEDPTSSATSRTDTSGSGSGDLDDSGSESGAASTSSTSPTSSSSSSVTTSSDDSSSGETSSACGDVFTDPDGDGALRLSGDDVFVLGPGPYEFSSICVQDSARLLVCDETDVFLGNEKISVIQGQGLGAFGTDPVVVNLHLEPNPAEAFIYFDAEVAPITLLLFASGADLTYALHGMAGVVIDGQNMQNNATYQGGGPMFPPCP